MAIATDEDRTVRRERARVIGSQSLSLYRSCTCSLARSRAVLHLLACARSLVVWRLDPQLPYQLGNMVRYGITCRQWPCFLFLVFFFVNETKEEGGRKSENQSLLTKHVVCVRKRNAKGEWESVCRRNRACCICFSICHTFAGGNCFCFCFCNAAYFNPADFSSIVCGWASILWLLCFLSLSLLRGSWEFHDHFPVVNPKSSDELPSKEWN